MFATYIEKIMHNMICVTVYSREEINMVLIGQVSLPVQNFNIGIFSDTIYNVNVNWKFYVRILLSWKCV